MVIALDQTILALGARGESEWQEEIKRLTRMREATIAKVHEVDPSVQFEAPIAPAPRQDGPR